MRRDDPSRDPSPSRDEPSADAPSATEASPSGEEASEPRWERDLTPLPVGVSSCLLGQPVRFDGGHKRNAFLTDRMAKFVRFVPVCPEVEAGLGTPRPSIRLEQRGSELRAVEGRAGLDHTDELRMAARAAGHRLEREQLCGYVFKKDSPSCGLFRVRVVQPDGETVRREGRGLYAELITRRFPDLPVEEEGRLQDALLRESFVERIFAVRRLQRLFEPGWTTAELVRFHSDHKFQLLAHSPEKARELGRLVAEAGRRPRELLRLEYSRGFLGVLSVRASRGRNVNALQHMLGFLRDHIDDESRHEVLERIAEYERGDVPITVPLTLLRHHARVHRIDYLGAQHFFEPHPTELRARQHLAS